MNAPPPIADAPNQTTPETTGADQLRSAGAMVPTAPRRQRRRRLLLVSAPVILATAVIAVKLVSLPISAGQAQAAWAGGDGDGGVRAGQSMAMMNLVERYKAHFALGDGYILRADYDHARTEFAAALELVPDTESCKVRVNLVLTLERLGEAKEQAGDPASAMDLFQQGTTVIQEAPRDCFTPNGTNNSDGEGDQLNDAAQRLAEKQQGGDEQGEDAEPSEPGDSGASDAQTPTDKLDQLEKNGQQAQRQRSEVQKLKDAFSEDSQEQYGKPW